MDSIVGTWDLYESTGCAQNVTPTEVRIERKTNRCVFVFNSYTVRLDTVDGSKLTGTWEQGSRQGTIQFRKVGIDKLRGGPQESDAVTLPTWHLIKRVSKAAVGA